MPHIYIFGASGTYGAWDIQGGWAQRLRKHFDTRVLKEGSFYCLTYNLGVSGDTTSSILKRFEPELKARLDRGEENIIIFSAGMNDSMFFPKKKAHNISPAKFRQNIKSLIKKAKKYSKKIIWLGIVPVDDKKMNPVPWKQDAMYSNEFIKKYNEAIKKEAVKENVFFIDMFDELLHSNYISHLIDGIHAGEKGHQIIFEKVRDFLEKNRFI